VSFCPVWCWCIDYRRRLCFSASRCQSPGGLLRLFLLRSVIELQLHVGLGVLATEQPASRQGLP
jgi:hypothetical protein